MFLAVNLFRKTQSGYASGTGTITLYFIDNDQSLGMRMLDNVMLSNQMGARVQLFINTVAGADAINLADSMYIDADINLTSMNAGSTLTIQRRPRWVSPLVTSLPVQAVSELFHGAIPITWPRMSGLFIG